MRYAWFFKIQYIYIYIYTCRYTYIYIYVDASLVRLTSFALLEPWGCVEVVRGVVREAVRKQNARGLS